MSKQKNAGEKKKKLNQKDALKLKKAQKAKRKKILLIVGIIVLLAALTVTIVLIANKCKRDKTYCAVINFGSYGSVTIALDEENAPKTVKNFERLVESGYYNGLSFTEISNGCIFGGSSEKEAELPTIFGEFKHNSTGSYQNELSHTKGVISMNRNSDPNSARAEFFITLNDMSSDLDGSYAAFGTIIEGMDVIERMAAEAEGSKDYAFPKITGITLEMK